MQFVQTELTSILPLELFMMMQNLSYQTLLSYAPHMGLSTQDLARSLHDALLRMQASQLISVGSYVPDALLKKEFMRRFATHTYSIVRISPESLRASVKEIPVSQAQLQEFYAAEKARARRYQVPEKREFVQWVIEPSAFETNSSDAEIQASYETRKNEFVETPLRIHVRRIRIEKGDVAHEGAARDTIQTIFKEVSEKPELFEQKAREYSMDKKTASAGGLMEPFAKGTHAQELEKAAFALKEAGAVSPVVETKDSFEILQFIKRISAEFKPLSQVKKEVKTALEQKKFKEQFAAGLKPLFEQRPDRAAIDAFVKKYNAKSSTQTISAKDTNPLSKHLFRLADQGSSSAIIDGKGYLIFVSSITSAFYPKLADIENELTTDWYTAQAQRKAQEMIKNSFKPDAPKIESYGTPVTVGPVSPADGKKADDILKKYGLSLRDVSQVRSVGQSLLLNTPTGLMAVRLDSMGAFDKDLFETHRLQLRREVEFENGTLITQGLVASLYKNGKIEKNMKKLSA
jgi:hypothetical protein